MPSQWQKMEIDKQKGKVKVCFFFLFFFEDFSSVIHATTIQLLVENRV